MIRGVNAYAFISIAYDRKLRTLSINNKQFYGLLSKDDKDTIEQFTMNLRYLSNKRKKRISFLRKSRYKKIKKTQVDHLFDFLVKKLGSVCYIINDCPNRKKFSYEQIKFTLLPYTANGRIFNRALTLSDVETYSSFSDQNRTHDFEGRFFPYNILIEDGINNIF